MYQKNYMIVYNSHMKEHYTKQLRRGALVKLDDDTLAVIRDNEPSVKRKVEVTTSGKPQIIEIESHRILFPKREGVAEHNPYRKRDKP